MEFVKLPKPIKVTKPIPVEFTEIYISPDVRWNFFKSVVDTVTILFGTKEGVTLFALREFIQNAIDQEIVKTNDFLNAYKNVKFEEKEGYYVIESEGDMPEESFELGYTTKTKYEEKGECCLIGRFGIGFKQGIGALKRQNYNVIIQTNGHVYMFAGVCGTEIKLDDISGDCRIAILRGPSNVKGKTIIYAEGSKLTTNLLWNSPYRVSESGSSVYHNGLYSGKWTLPYSVNICCVDADEYRTVVSTMSHKMMKLLNELYESLTKEEREIIVKAIKNSAKISENIIMFDYPQSYDRYFTDFPDIAEALIQLAKELNISVIVLGNEPNPRISTTQFIFKGMPCSYLYEVVKEIRKKGYSAYSMSEWISLRTIESLKEASIPYDKLPDELKAGIILGRWLFNVAYRTRKMSAYYNVMSEDIEKIEIYVLSDNYGAWEESDLGITKYEPKPTIFIAPPKLIQRTADAQVFDVFISSEEEAVIFTVATVVFHELIHAIYRFYQHGSFNWELFFNILIYHAIHGSEELRFLQNIANIAFYDYQLLQGVKRIYGLSDFIIEPDAVIELRHATEILGRIENGVFRITSEEKPDTKLKVIKEEDKLEFRFEPLQ